MKTEVKSNISWSVTSLIIVLKWLFAAKGLWWSNHSR